MAWEDKLTAWAEGPSDTERQKCENAESVVRSAIRASKTLQALDIRVFTQGSYAARTNVRLDSDVDICVCRENIFYYDLPPNGSQNPVDYGIYPRTITFADYKSDVGAALTAYLGAKAVSAGNKAFDVHANTYRVDADVVPALEYRRYTGFDTQGSPRYFSGIEIIADSGERIINWPQQAYANGVAKNDGTERKYKRVVRVLKRLRNAMQDNDIADAQDVASFLLESLVWNTPDDLLAKTSYYESVREVLIHLYNGTKSQSACDDWREVSGLKYLFRDDIQPWTRDKAHKFILAAWQYVGYK